MRKYNILLSIIIIFSVTLTLLSLSMNIVYRSSSVYSFYFNDTRVVERLYTSRSANEMADEISGYMNSFTDEPFSVMEDTGYDLENIFTEDEGFNMLIIKKLFDKSFLVGLISLIITCYIYFHFIRANKKKVLRDRFYISLGLSIAGTIAEYAMLLSSYGQAKLIEKFELIELPESNYLALLLGSDFLIMSLKFLAAVSIIVFVVASYIALKLTKPDRIFF